MAASIPPDDSPLVLFLLDTSGGMERLPGLECTTRGCLEALPKCENGERSQWALLVEALAGSYESFGCETLDRIPENGCSYDCGYFMPMHRFTQSVVQRNDGILDVYGDRLRFGIATFDSIPTWTGSEHLVEQSGFDWPASQSVDGLFSYGAVLPDGTQRRREDGHMVGDYVYAGEAGWRLQMDTGIRSSLAEDGALLVPHSLRESVALRDTLKRELREVHTFGGHPSAAALDDVAYYFGEDPASVPLSATPGHTHGRYVVLITSGLPDSDFRDYGCDCKREQNCPDEDTNVDVHCPYPTAPDAAKHLRCSGASSNLCEDGLIRRVFVVAFGLSPGEFAQPAVGQLSDIATAGGTDLRLASDGKSLRGKLLGVMREIVALEY